MRQLRMLDLPAEFALFGDDIRAAVGSVLDTQRFIGGPVVEELETAIAARCETKHAIAVSSGTDALLCTLMAYQIGQGDEVIVPTFTFFATAGSVYRLGAKPVFVDIDERTFNLRPEAVEAAVTSRTKAIIAVHLFGQCAEMDAINTIARRHGLCVIEDAAQAIGATYHGRPAGSLGDAACLSFYPTKNLGGFGEGGMILTGDDDFAKTLRELRNHGQSDSYVHGRVGGNFRFDAMKAAILLVKLRFLTDFTARRRGNATRYHDLLGDVGVACPFVPDGHEPVYHQYSLTCDRRDELRKNLKERGVETGVYYPIPLHLQDCFAVLGGKPGSCPVAERVSGRVVSLPCHPMVSGDDVAYVASCIREFFDMNRAACVSGAGGNSRQTKD